MLEALSEVALRNSEFRKSLPPGYARKGFRTGDAERTFSQLVDQFKDEADFNKVFSLFIDNFARSTEVDIRDGLLLASTGINDRDQFVLRPNVPARIEVRGEEAIVICPGGDVHFDAGLLDCLNIVLSGNSFSASDFEIQSTSESRKLIRKLLSFGLIKGVNTRTPI